METFASEVDDWRTQNGDAEPPYLHAYVIHHTHWDREWWATFQDFRIRLVEIIDALLDTLDADPSFRGFLLDGQMSVVRDYLEVRPENRERLAGYLRKGRIQCGPWYILPDEFLVSGESHIHNLLLARRAARDLDVPLLQVGYIPDTFGHVSQMPQILRGFDIDNAFIWRGLGGTAEDLKEEFLWEAPDGSSVLTHWFPDSYYQMPFLHFDNPDRPPEDKLGRIHAAFEHFGARATTDVVLMPYGGDHRPIDPRLAAKIALANEDMAGKGDIRWATPDEYIAAIRERNPQLATIQGELRGFGPDNPHVLPGVLSARLYLKRLNFTGQTWLQRYAEPLSAVAWLQGSRYDDGLLWKAWELLIQNHPHDSICGCSIDEVHREMLTRFAGSRQIAEILAEKSAKYVNSRIDTSGLGPTDRALVVHNTLPRTRAGHSSVWIERTDMSPLTHRLLDGDGAEVPFQIRDVERVLPMTDKYRYTEIEFVSPDVPALGYRTFQLVSREQPLNSRTMPFNAVQPVARLKGSEQRTDLSVGANTLENAFLHVRVQTSDGTLSVTDKRSGEVYQGLNAFEDGGDAGDTYNYSAPLNDMVLRSTGGAGVHVSVAEVGYARATLRIDLYWALPCELSADRLSRSSRSVSGRISTFVSLSASTPRVDIVTEWENASKEHRLRALFPVGVDPEVSHAEGHFAVTDRPVAVPEAGNGWDEPYVSTMPQGGWVSVGEATRGLTVANRGLPEYEVLNDGHGTIAVTLLRAVGWLSREDLLSRVGGAGPQLPVPDAQSLGPNRAGYGIIPHAGDWLESKAYESAEDYLAPLYGSWTDRHAGDLPPSAGLLALEGDHTLLCSACKKSEVGDALIIRFWNVAQHTTSATLRTSLPVKTIRLVDLKEEPVGDTNLSPEDDGSYVIEAGPAQILTVAIEV